MLAPHACQTPSASPPSKSPTPTRNVVAPAILLQPPAALRIRAQLTPPAADAQSAPRRARASRRGGLCDVGVRHDLRAGALRVPAARAARDPGGDAGGARVVVVRAAGGRSREVRRRAVGGADDALAPLEFRFGGRREP